MIESPSISFASHPSATSEITECLEEALMAPGFTARMHLSETELTAFREEIDRQWIDHLAAAAPGLVDEARELGIARYHELAGRLEHERLWPKASRILPRSSVARLKALPLFTRLREVFGDFTIAEGFHGSTHLEGLEEIYWRLVRPGCPTDVGPLHADHWFHDIMDMKGRAFPERCFTVKIWIPIHCEAGRNGLMMVPDSHRKTWRHSTQWVNGQPKPKFDDEAHPILIATEPGQMLIFHERTLHGGALNQGGRTRVSAEITMVFPSEQQLLDRLRATISA